MDVLANRSLPCFGFCLSHTVVHANIVNDRNGDENHIRVEEVPNDSKGIISFDNNFSVLVCIDVRSESKIDLI